MVKEYLHQIELSVRDYECDILGIVNNAWYQFYLEHARHQMLLMYGVDFAGLFKKGISLVLTRVEIDYKHSLTSKDQLIVCTNWKREGNIRFVFFQDIFKKEDSRLVAKAKITGTCIKGNKPYLPPEIVAIIEKSS